MASRVKRVFNGGNREGTTMQHHLRAAGRALASISIAVVPTLTSAAVPYVVVDGTYQEGCFAPCLCPMLLQAPLSGTFQLDLVGPGNVFDFYAVSDVRWFASNATVARRIAGDGTYKVGELTTQQDLELDLSINQNAPEHFSSGTVDTTVRFPDIAVTISKHGAVCQDTVMGLRARPTPGLAVERDALVWDSGLEIPGYDVVIGKLRALRQSGGDFSLAISRCVANDVHDSTVPFLETPLPDDGLFILVRAAGSTYDSFAPSQVRSRDPGIAASPAACP